MPEDITALKREKINRGESTNLITVEGQQRLVNGSLKSDPMPTSFVVETRKGQERNGGQKKK